MLTLHRQEVPLEFMFRVLWTNKTKLTSYSWGDNSFPEICFPHHSDWFTATRFSVNKQFGLKVVFQFQSKAAAVDWGSSCTFSGHPIFPLQEANIIISFCLKGYRQGPPHIISRKPTCKNQEFTRDQSQQPVTFKLTVLRFVTVGPKRRYEAGIRKHKQSFIWAYTGGKTESTPESRKSLIRKASKSKLFTDVGSAAECPKTSSQGNVSSLETGNVLVPLDRWSRNNNPALPSKGRAKDTPHIQ